MKSLNFARYAFITAAVGLFATSSDAAWTYTETNTLNNINQTCIPKELYSGKVGVGYITDDNWTFHAFRSIDANDRDIYVDASRWEEIKEEKTAPINFSEINEGFKVVYFVGVKESSSLIKKYATELVAPECSNLAGGNSFVGSEVLTNVTLCATEAVLFRNDRLFQACTNLVSFTPNKIAGTSLRIEMFNGCSSLEGEFEFPECTSFANKNVFNGCAKLGGIKAENAISVGQSSFAGCASLSNIVLSSSVESVGNYAFNGCSRITTEFVQGLLNKDLKQLGNSITDRKGCFVNCAGLTGSLVWNLPNLITNAVPDDCFNGCSSLERVEFKTPVSVIGAGAFKNIKSGAEIFLHETPVETYGSYAFATEAAPFPKVYIKGNNDTWLDRMYSDSKNHLIKIEQFNDGSWVSKNRDDVTWGRNIKNMIMKDTSMCSEVDGKVVVNDKKVLAFVMSETKAGCWVLRAPLEKKGFRFILR